VCTAVVIFFSAPVPPSFKRELGGESVVLALKTDPTPALPLKGREL
jgi:hypothetical protein